MIVRDRHDPGLDRRGAIARLQQLFGFLTGGATAICGASAALALSAALPAHPGKEKATTFTVIGVSTLSTLAMILYPMLASLQLDLSPVAAGVFIGGSIHEVAQVVGAGYSMSRETGDVATVVKLMRVAMLLPVIVCAAMITRAQGDESCRSAPAAVAVVCSRVRGRGRSQQLRLDRRGTCKASATSCRVRAWRSR